MVRIVQIYLHIQDMEWGWLSPKYVFFHHLPSSELWAYAGPMQCNERSIGSFKCPALNGQWSSTAQGYLADKKINKSSNYVQNSLELNPKAEKENLFINFHISNKSFCQINIAHYSQPSIVLGSPVSLNYWRHIWTFKRSSVRAGWSF